MLHTKYTVIIAVAGIIEIKSKFDFIYRDISNECPCYRCPLNGLIDPR